MDDSGEQPAGSDNRIGFEQGQTYRAAAELQRHHRADQRHYGCGRSLRAACHLHLPLITLTQHSRYREEECVRVCPMGQEDLFGMLIYLSSTVHFLCACAQCSLRLLFLTNSSGARRGS